MLPVYASWTFSKWRQLIPPKWCLWLDKNWYCSSNRSKARWKNSVQSFLSWKRKRVLWVDAFVVHIHVHVNLLSFSTLSYLHFLTTLISYSFSLPFSHQVVLLSVCPSILTPFLPSSCLSFLLCFLFLCHYTSFPYHLPNNVYLPVLKMGFPVFL